MNFWVCSPAIFDQIEQDLRSFIESGENLDKGEVYLPFVIQAMLQRGATSVKVIRENTFFSEYLRLQIDQNTVRMD